LAYEAIEANVKTKGEFYIATAIDYAIKKGYNFKNFEVDDWVSLGDPIELQIYEFWYKLFVEDTYILSSDGRL
jgi:dTDP-glucose pyrophosphorylase